MFFPWNVQNQGMNRTLFLGNGQICRISNPVFVILG
jgi:hypothetical protein